LLDVSYGAQPVDGVEPASFGRADGEMYAMKRAHKS
jgi:hypothetical protein